MAAFSDTIYDVFKFSRVTPVTVKAKIEVDMKILKLYNLTRQQWKKVKKVQGSLAATYLKLRYGGPDTYISLSFVAEELAHVQWIVPAEKIQARYPFVRDNSYFITSCVTEVKFRGNRIYTSQLRKVIDSDIASIEFWGSASKTNIASLKGISRAGGIKTGEYVHKKWFWGIFSSIKCYSDDEVIISDR